MEKTTLLMYKTCYSLTLVHKISVAAFKHCKNRDRLSHLFVNLQNTQPVKKSMDGGDGRIGMMRMDM